MNLLPIVERELRVTARRGTTHWARFGLTLVLALATINSLSNTGSSPPGLVAKSIFTWLMTSAFVLACAACTLTADALSGESREGTLGLLFLTDLRSWDVTLGKLVSSGLGALYVGLALVPVLMLPVLAGGVSAFEAARVGMTLIGVIVFALAAGLAASSREQTRGRALRRAGLWVGGTVLLPAISGWLVSSDVIAVLSPITTLRLAQDSEYRITPILFWVSLLLQFLHAAVLLWSTGAGLRRQLNQPRFQTGPSELVKPASSPSEAVYSVDPASNASYQAANELSAHHLQPARPLKESKPLEWLILRQPGQRALCWIAALMLFFGYFGALVPWFRVGTRGGLPLGVYSLLQLSWVANGLLALAACRFFVEARRSGELEILLTTPEGARTLISAHWAAMKRLLLWPAMVAVMPLLMQSCALLLTSSPSPRINSFQFYSSLYAAFCAVEVILALFALNWLGMLFGLTARRLISAVGLTMALAVGLPMLLHSMVQFLTRSFFPSGAFSLSWLITALIQYPIAWASLVSLSLWARNTLRRGPTSELFEVDWALTAKDTARRLGAILQRWRWLTPGDQARTDPVK